MPPFVQTQNEGRIYIIFLDDDCVVPLAFHTLPSITFQTLENVFWKRFQLPLRISYHLFDSSGSVELWSTFHKIT